MAFGIAEAVGIGSSLLGGMFGSSSSKKAAKAQARAAQAALDEQKRVFNTIRADATDYRDTGTAANLKLNTLLGIGKDTSNPEYGAFMRDFTQDDLNNDAVYQNGLEFGLNEGTKAIDRRSAAMGGYDSGATLKALTKYGNDYGTTKAGDAYTRFMGNRSNKYNMLQGGVNTGLNALGVTSGAGQKYGNNASQLITSAGDSRAAGIMGGANAWSDALTGLNKVNFGNVNTVFNPSQPSGNASPGITNLASYYSNPNKLWG